MRQHWFKRFHISCVYRFHFHVQNENENEIFITRLENIEDKNEFFIFVIFFLVLVHRKDSSAAPNSSRVSIPFFSLSFYNHSTCSVYFIALYTIRNGKNSTKRTKKKNLGNRLIRLDLWLKSTSVTWAEKRLLCKCITVYLKSIESMLFPLYRHNQWETNVWKKMYENRANRESLFFFLSQEKIEYVFGNQHSKQWKMWTFGFNWKQFSREVEGGKKRA